METIILASKSPRRLELLRQIGIPVSVVPSLVEEHPEGNSPEEIVKSLSRQKCLDTAGRIRDGIVLGADTIVVLEGEILGKPKNEAEAFVMLSSVSGGTHEVYTGVTLAGKREGGLIREESFSVCTKVTVCSMTEDEILSYIATGDPMDKAGAYGIQGMFARYVEKIEGDYSNVVGLPVSAVYGRLKSWGAADQDRSLR